MLSNLAAGRPHRICRGARRQLILEVTLASLGRNGSEGTSLRSVCRDMGVAPSLITHSFRGWHEILVAACNLLTERFLEGLTPILTAEFGHEPDRMRALIEACLTIDWMGENTVGAMIAFWQLSRSVEPLKQPFARFLADRHDRIQQAIAALAAEAGIIINTGEATEAFLSMMDGIWLHMALDSGHLSVQKAQSVAWIWLRRLIGETAWHLPALPESVKLTALH